MKSFELRVFLRYPSGGYAALDFYRDAGIYSCECLFADTTERETELCKKYAKDFNKKHSRSLGNYII